MALIETLKQKIQEREENHLYRRRKVINNRINQDITIKNEALVNFSSNDYLGLSSHPRIQARLIEGLKQYGLGSCSSALISGYYQPHALLEEKLAEYFNRDKAVIFNSGYLANIAVMTTLAPRNSYIVSDRLVHASILDGIILSRAKHLRYSHNNLLQLQNLLLDTKAPTLIVTEGIFSMEGDITPVDKIAEMGMQHQCTLVVDDAHGVGVLGQNGKGICEHFKISQQAVPCLVVPFGKAFASLGAAVLGKAEIIEGLLQFARTYCYTTSLPPALCLALLTTLNVMQAEKWRHEKLHALIKIFNDKAFAHGLSLISYDSSPIKSIMIGDIKKGLALQDWLITKGFYTVCIRPPTVPQKTTRLRISLSSLHEEKNIVDLLSLIAGFISKNE